MPETNKPNWNDPIDWRIVEEDLHNSALQRRQKALAEGLMLDDLEWRVGPGMRERFKQLSEDPNNALPEGKSLYPREPSGTWHEVQFSTTPAEPHQLVLCKREK